MNVTKIRLTRNYVMADRVWFEGDVFYCTAPHRKGGSSTDRSDLYSEGGVFVVRVDGHWFDFPGTPFEGLR